MGLRVNLPEPGDAVVRVDLRGLQRGVAQKLLNLAHVGSAVQQVRGERMPQYVRAFLALYARAGEFLLHRAVDDAPGYALPFMC